MTHDFKSQMDHWLADQAARWQALAAGTPSPEGESWATLIGKYQSASLKDLPGQHADMINLITNQSARFTAFAESLLTQTDRPTDLSALVEQFQQYMHQQTLDALSQQWNLPEPLASLLQSQPLKSTMLTEGPLRNYLEQLIASPDIASPAGTTNPFSQLQIRNGAQTLLDYQQALADYIAQHEQIFNTTGDRLKQALMQQSPPIDSIKQLHTLWVDCYEKTYSETVFTETYQTSHGRISNSLMRLQNFAQQMRDSKLKEYGFVTRSELNNTLKQQHALRKQIRQQQASITQLQQQVQQLQSDAQRKPARRKTSP